MDTRKQFDLLKAIFWILLSIALMPFGYVLCNGDSSALFGVVLILAAFCFGFGAVTGIRASFSNDTDKQP